MSAADVRTGTPAVHTESTESAALAIAADAPRAVAVASEFGATSMQQLLHFAIEKGTPVEQLERLVDLAERMEAKQAARAFHTALARFQDKVEPVFRAKTAEVTMQAGGKFSYKYAELDDIVHAIKSPLHEEGLSYTWNTRVDKNMLTVDTVVRHVEGHSETTSFTLPIDNKSAMSEQQKYGAALTFGQRRGLSAALGLVTTSEDPDSPKLDPTPISDDQATVINDLLTETRMPLSRFLKYFEAASVDKIRAVDYQTAVGILEDRVKKGRT
jgi:hypothetical protein